MKDLVEAPVIHGERVSNAAESAMPTFNPATGEVIATFQVASAATVDAAVASGARAQREWWSLAGRNRAQILWAWGDLIERNATELAELDVAEVGKVIVDARAELNGAVRVARYWSGAVERIVGRTIPTMPGHLTYTTREPLGVVGAILPWNAPAAVMVARSAPALACGNAVVVKPSEHSPLSALRLAELAVEAGMPAGLLNVIPGDGSTGAHLAAHEGIGGVTFVGGVPAGRAVSLAAAGHFAKILLELGGKAPNIIFADADLQAAIDGSTWGIFHNAGQICAASSRLLVHESIAEHVVDAISHQASNIRVGDPMSPDSLMGPLATKPQYERVVDFIASGREAGATLRAGGHRPDGVHPEGYYVSPTVFTDVDREMRIGSEEIFGPVLSVFTFRTETEAIELANSLEFGLTANVWTSKLDRALGIADQIHAGSVFINSALVLDPSLPFGGHKNSGLGNGNGFEALDEFTQTKRVSINYGGVAPSWSGLDAVQP